MNLGLMSFDLCEKKECELTDADFHDMSRKPREQSSSLPVELILEHPGHRTLSIIKAEIPIFNDVGILKEDMEKILNVSADKQDWWFKGKQLQNSDVLGHMAIRRDDKITVRQISGKLSVEGMTHE